MPRWLRHDRQFLRWYRQSALRHDPYLPWWKVYRVYERHYALRYPYHDSRDWRYDRDRGHHRDRYDDREDRHDDRPRRRDRR